MWSILIDLFLECLFRMKVKAATLKRSTQQQHKVQLHLFFLHILCLCQSSGKVIGKYTFCGGLV